MYVTTAPSPDANLFLDQFYYFLFLQYSKTLSTSKDFVMYVTKKSAV